MIPLYVIFHDCACISHNLYQKTDKKDFKKLATDLDLKIISTFDVLSQKKFENGKIPSNLFCKEVLFHITNEH